MGLFLRMRRSPHAEADGINAQPFQANEKNMLWGNCHESQRKMTFIQAPARLKRSYDFYIF
jgi:hypothetical protein